MDKEYNDYMKDFIADHFNNMKDEKHQKMIKSFFDEKQKEYDNKWKKKISKPFGILVRKMKDGEADGIALSLETPTLYLAKFRVDYVKKHFIPFAQEISNIQLKFEHMFFDEQDKVFRVRICLDSKNLVYLKNKSSDCIFEKN